MITCEFTVSRNLKHEIVRDLPIMFKILQVTNKGPMMSAQKVYQQLVNEDEGGPRHVINTPRDQNQIKNFQKDENRQFRISHNGIYNTYQLCFQLQLKDRKGEPQNFLRNFQVYPTVCVHMVPHPLLENLEMLLKVSTTPVTLHYDTVFNMGDFYLSTLVFRNAIFKKDPITPVAFFIHSRRFQEDHMLFMKTIRKSLPLLASKKILMVTDREFDFSDVFPMCLNVFCWNHLERDFHFYLKNSANCKPSEISYYANSFKALMIEENEDDFDSSWSITKASFTNPTVLRYFEQKLLPAFKEHSSIWKLREMGVSELMIGQDISDHTKPNMTLLTQRVRQKNKERPSGRKPPRKRDFDRVAANSKFIVFPIDVYIFLYFHITDVNDSEGEGETVHNSHQSMEQKDGRNIGSTSIVLSYIHV